MNRSNTVDYENIIVEKGDDFVAEITLNRPNHLNAFTRLCPTEDAGEEITAFKEKRKPVWREK